MKSETEKCPYCGKSVVIVDSSVVYGEWAEKEKRPFLGRQQKIDKGYNIAMSSLILLLTPIIKK